MRARADRWTATWTLGSAIDDARAWDGWTQALASGAGHVFHRPDLIRMWMDTVGAAAGALPAIAAITSEEGITGRVAAVVAPHRGAIVTRRVIEPAGQDLFGYHDPLFERTPPRRAMDGFWSTMRETAPAHDGALFRFVDRTLAPGGFRLDSSDESPVLALDGAASLDDVLARCSVNHRGDVRRRLRRLRERGTLALRVYGSGEAADAAKSFAEGCWPSWVKACQRIGTRLFERPGLRAYCDRLLLEGLATGLAHYSTIVVNGVEIAWHLGLQDRGRLYWWLPAQDPAWNAWSPGKAALALLIESAVAAGCRELHFQTGAQPYKLAWKPDLPARVAIGWPGVSWRGRALGFYDALRRTARS
jgi:CelD/BcsL family acetyltransferase involved in cellulose biosynthesis